MTDETKNIKNKETGKFVRNVVIKGVLLFLVLNFAVALIPIGGKFGRVSLYNLLFPGRARLPFGENPDQAYNLSLYDLKAMFASHDVNKSEKTEDEFRVILIGDSATWGTLLTPEDTLSGLINQAQLVACDGRKVKAYNLAYPSMSLTKDLMLLTYAIKYQPDLILWPMTLESFPNKIQISTPLVANNSQQVQPLIQQFDLNIEDYSKDFVQFSFWDRTLIGRRRAIFDAIQLQYYGIMWAATGIDQTYPTNFTPAQRDFSADEDQFKGLQPGTLPLDELAFDVLAAGISLAKDIPVLIINEPILISQGENSDVRYNFFYPRWAYDQYRQAMLEQSKQADWAYVDLWDLVPPEEFTNSAVHLTPQGMQGYFQGLLPSLKQMICP
jgi:hypothetical protein